MAYVVTPNGNQPQNQTTSQIRGNFAQANTSFGTDHYAFDDGTANNGFHKVIRTPDQTSDPATTTNPIIYGKLASANVGVIQYSRGPSNAAPSPITLFQSTIAAITIGTNTNVNMLNFSGLTLAIAEAYAYDTTTGLVAQYAVTYDGTTLRIDRINTNSNLQMVVSSTTLQVRNNSNTVAMNGVYWTIQFLRIA